MPDRARLPKWAQDEFAALERNLDVARRLLAERPVSDTVVDPGYMEGDGGYLDDKSRVRFYFLPGQHGPSDPWIEVCRQNGQLRVSAADALHVHPHVTNILYLDVTDRLKDFRS